MDKLKIEIGTRFGSWEVIDERTQVISNVTNWICRCDCGKEQFVPLNNLMNGSSTQCRKCGSITGGKKRRKGYEDISGNYWSQLVYKIKKKGIPFELRIEDAWDVYLKQERKCALSGFDIYFSGYPYDRKKTNAALSLINVNGGYTKDNIQWIDKKLDKFKKNLDNQELLQIVNRIYGHQIQLQKKAYDETHKKS